MVSYVLLYVHCTLPYKYFLKWDELHETSKRSVAKVLFQSIFHCKFLFLVIFQDNYLLFTVPRCFVVMKDSYLDIKTLLIYSGHLLFYLLMRCIDMLRAFYILQNVTFLQVK